jgi:hypothetical protein
MNDLEAAMLAAVNDSVALGALWLDRHARVGRLTSPNEWTSALGRRASSAGYATTTAGPR